jgi:hypothetical protein
MPTAKRRKSPAKKRTKKRAKPTKLYLVRWPGLVASLVRASSRKELAKILTDDNTRDYSKGPNSESPPSEYTVMEYDGPLYLDFTPPGTHDYPRPTERELDLSEFDRGGGVDVEIGQCREGIHTDIAIFSRAFPLLDKAFLDANYPSFDDPRDKPVPASIIEAAKREVGLTQN